MLHHGEAGMAGMRRRRLAPRPLRRGTGYLPEGRTFEEDLALFERQVWEEAGWGYGAAVERAPVDPLADATP